jgi:hypothetical protein
MIHARTFRTIAVLVLLAMPAAAMATSPVVPSQAKPQAFPNWGHVEKIVKDSLASRDGYKPGDIIAKSDVRAALTKLAAHGWKPADGQEIIKATPGDEEFIVSRLRAPAGRNFMRHVATYPEGYDRVDHLLHMPRGEMMVADLITNPGGYKLFQYMTTSQGGVEMGRMLERIPSGKDFNDSTHRLYTADKLLVRLRKSYDVEVKRREREARQG